MKNQENNILMFVHWSIFNRIFWAFIGMDTINKLARITTDNTGISLLGSHPLECCSSENREQ